jgi:biotin transport system substrate-specific component
LSKDIAVPFTSAAGAAATPASWLRAGGVVLAGSAFVAICAHVLLPLYFTPVPLSLQPFAVLVLGLLLSPRLGAATLAAYLAEGALGLPVFSPSPVMPGMAHLLGPTGGYLLAYPAAVALIAFLWRRVSYSTASRGFAGAALSAAAGNLVILAGGGLWLAVLTHASMQSALTLGVLPFLPGDALKIAAAAAVAVGFQRFRRRAA